MGFKEIADLDCDKTVAIGGTDKKSGKPNLTTITGYYIGSRDVESPKSKNGKAKLHVFQTKTGNVGVWGKTNLDQKMLGVNPGVLTKVSFTGMVPTKNQPMYKYKVECDTENTIEVAAPAESDGATSEETYEELSEHAGYENEPSEDPALDEEEAPLDETPPARTTAPKHAAAPADPAGRAAVQNLLKNNGARRA